MSMRALEWVIYAVTMVTTLAVAGVFVMLVLPSLVVIVLRRLRYGGAVPSHPVAELDRAGGSDPVAGFGVLVSPDDGVEGKNRTMNSGATKNGKRMGGPPADQNGIGEASES